MNGDTLREWFNEKLLHTLKEKILYFVDNASYHSVPSESNPTSSTRKADLQEWLRKHNVPFDNTMLAHRSLLRQTPINHHLNMLSITSLKKKNTQFFAYPILSRSRSYRNDMVSN